MDCFQKIHGTPRHWLLSKLILTLTLLFAVSTHAQFQKRIFTSIVLDAHNMRILSKHRSDVKVYPASLTKMMTLYLLFEAIENGQYSLDDLLLVSRRASLKPPSKLHLTPGSAITVRNAIGALVNKSANDVACVVAEAVGGTEAKFAVKMTAKARKLGMLRTNFHNASGLPHKQQLTTAKDMAILGRALFTHFPGYKPYFLSRHFAFRGKEYPNSNKLLGQIRGVNGIKTGYTAASGFNLVASAERHGQWLIAVAMGSPSGRQRNNQTAQMLEANFKKMDQGYVGHKIAPLPPYTPPKRPANRTARKTITPEKPGSLLSSRVRGRVPGREITGRTDTEPRIDPRPILEQLSTYKFPQTPAIQAPRQRHIRGIPLPSHLPERKRIREEQGLKPGQPPLKPTDSFAYRQDTPSLSRRAPSNPLALQTPMPGIKPPYKTPGGNMDADEMALLTDNKEGRTKRDPTDDRTTERKTEAVKGDMAPSGISNNETEAGSADNSRFHLNNISPAEKKVPLLDKEDPVVQITLAQEYGLRLTPQCTLEKAESLIHEAVSALSMQGLVDKKILKESERHPQSHLKPQKTLRKPSTFYTPLILGFAPSEITFARAILDRKGIRAAALKPTNQTGSGQ